MSKQLTVCGVAIKQDAEGRYCLNDLHKAAGAEPRHKPALWERQAGDLIDELRKGTDSYPLQTRLGRNGGTFVVKELVYAYAMWISPKFHLEVIRSYDRLATEGVAVHQNAAADVLANPLKYMRSLIEQAEKLQAENEAMHKELNLLTVDEYRALTHRYFSHSYKVRLGQAAARVMREQGQRPERQERTLRSGKRERLVSVGVYTRAALEQAERELSA
ncbi:KilA-N domain-containing protein [Stutzerimonas stutzeri]|uniref:KilA-N domain-containing protein n=1 Tax=Stutzerimonas stutzeri TaxID=316 RepID=UPI003C2CDEB0